MFFFMYLSAFFCLKRPMEKQLRSSEKVRVCTMHIYGEGTFLFTWSSEYTKEVFTHGLLLPWFAYLTFSLQWPLQCSYVLMHWALVFSQTVMVCVWMAPWGFSTPLALTDCSHLLFRKLLLLPFPSLCPLVHPDVLNCLQNVCTVELRSHREKLASVWFIYYQRHWGLEGYFHTELFQWNDTTDIFRLL